MLRGKLEFASGEEGREAEHLVHLLRRSTADTAPARLRGIDLTPLADAVSRSPVRTGERVPPRTWSRRCPGTAVEAVLTDVAKRLDGAGGGPGPIASAAELALELLFLTRRLAKDESGDDTGPLRLNGILDPWERTGHAAARQALRRHRAAAW